MRWGGLSKGGKRMDAIDSAEYSGSLISLLQEAQAFVKRNSRVTWNKAPTERIEYHDYLERPVQEVLVNAFAHRDYLELGSEVHVDMFDDRMEIYSPGGMIDGSRVQDQDIRNIPSRRRNPLLADIFEKLGYMERQGSGLKDICDEIEAANNYTEDYKPEFYSDHGQFRVTFWNMNYNSDVGQEVGQGVGQGVGQDVGQTNMKDKIVLIIKDNNKVSKKKIGEMLGVSEKTIEREMKEMPNVIFVGSGYSGHWEIKE